MRSYNSVPVRVVFKDGDVFEGDIEVNAITGYLVFDNDGGQMNVEEKAIESIDFLVDT